MLKSLQKLSQDADEVVAATIAILHCINHSETACDVNTQVIVAPPVPQPSVIHAVDNEQVRIWEKKILDAEEGQKIAAISFAKARREMELLAAKNAILEKQLEAPAEEISKLKHEIEKLNSTITGLQADLKKAQEAARAIDADRQNEKSELAAAKEKCHEAIETAKKLSIQSEKRKEQRDSTQKERDAVILERDALQKEIAAIKEQYQATRTSVSQSNVAIDEGRAAFEQRITDLKVLISVADQSF
jgi:chromosome segregation ATPase